jgi:hypothetical protein
MSWRLGRAAVGLERALGRADVNTVHLAPARSPRPGVMRLVSAEPTLDRSAAGVDPTDRAPDPESAPWSHNSSPPAATPLGSGCAI